MSNKTTSQSTRPVIVIHGGAGTILKEKMTPDVEKKLRTGLYEATKKGYDVLRNGRRAIDAVEAAVCALEDNPLFNAGKGAVFNSKGVNQLEASIMDGETGAAGAGSLLTTVKNPIKLARKVLESNHHVFLGGTGAETYAHDEGLEIVNPAYFWTRHRWEQHERGFLHTNCLVPSVSANNERTPSAVSSDCTATLGEDTLGDYSHLPMGTVGAVAVDDDGNLAAATSTGGMSNKWDGRIGDTPIIGAGTWADKNVAVSGTGTGEYYIRQGTAHSIASRMKLLDEGVGTASATTMAEMMEMGGDGGVICVDSSGSLSMAFCSAGMYRGYCCEQTDHLPIVGIFSNEVIAPGDNHIDQVL
ncbi:hypothetical protein IW140_005948 [Coemansia sp. RSA 1813]|nr:hypothetical protein EV178_006510 [Coemansia sp. RSA 1646]KAJ1767540.1 hypothetical protein LPJ74_005320 [Coemansia sp. RSA 1843]KAJ2084968.1 hypothetical protein IW138_006529 [Coemansia sp. RSA 986]KAJ2210071.1 hypothetical protein EV179_006444 [Coemansia sp. RSA 487]KAJ2563886.1 hypothetical protein IW140_005948 [Coemansia sp. RSA 1813]